MSYILLIGLVSKSPYDLPHEAYLDAKHASLQIEADREPAIYRSSGDVRLKFLVLNNTKAYIYAAGPSIAPYVMFRLEIRDKQRGSLYQPSQAPASWGGSFSLSTGGNPYDPGPTIVADDQTKPFYGLLDFGYTLAPGTYSIKACVNARKQSFCSRPISIEISADTGA